MVNQVGSALAHIVVVAATRRLELALPEHLPLVSMLPMVLRQAGEETSDGQQYGGWTLRRTDGSALDLARSLAAQQVRDGEILHLAPQRTEWPELAYDDVVDVIAAGATRRGRAWTAPATRLAGLVCAVAALLTGLGVVLLAGEPGWIGGGAALATSVALMLTGMVLSRALADSISGTVLATLGLPYAFVGSMLLPGGDGQQWSIGAPHFLLGFAGLLLAGVIGYLAVGDGSRVFVAGIVASLCGLLGGALSVWTLDGPQAAAVVVSLVTLLLSAMPLLAVQLAKMPLPAVPRTAEDLLRDDPQPSQAVVRQATVRADEIFTGLVFGIAAVTVAGLIMLTMAGTVGTLLLTGIVAGACLLRARLLVTVRHRVPLLVAGVTGLALIPLLAAASAPAVVRLAVLLPLLVLVAALTVTAGLTYSRRPPSPRLARLGDTLDIVLQLAVIPVTCSVLGLYGFMRALNG